MYGERPLPADVGNALMCAQKIAHVHKMNAEQTVIYILLCIFLCGLPTQINRQLRLFFLAYFVLISTKINIFNKHWWDDVSGDSKLHSERSKQKVKEIPFYKYIRNVEEFVCLKVHKIENFFGSDFEFCTIPLLVMFKY